MAVVILTGRSYVANAQAPACAGLLAGLSESAGGVTSITETLTRSYLAGDTLRSEFTPYGGGPHTATITDVTLGAIRIDLTAATPPSPSRRSAPAQASMRLARIPRG
jgi:hypothetical protein